ncbi:hypothetical protein [Vibrio algarum]|uniref:DUF2946 domain-containing protein n=1 Tax=Vibrio algarum TaxID=3020714 RepID=A0ABT4YW81_9VIBR|nr:hypothetical protein [Vibrio sp. KJ40-1]MDB1125821.1 hypothetical protein [Vibrio sp. KJ40-1]
MLLRTQSLLLTCFLLISLLMMSFSASASVVVSFSNYDICPVESENVEIVFADPIQSDNVHIESKTSAASQCCASASHALYPPFSLSQSLHLAPSFSLALIEKEHPRKNNFLAQSLYKPPIA